MDGGVVDNLKIALAQARDESAYDPRTVRFPTGDEQDPNLPITICNIAQEQGLEVCAMRYIKEPHIVGNGTWVLYVTVRRPL